MMRECVHASTRSPEVGPRAGERISRVTVREPRYTVGGSPDRGLAFRRAGPDSTSGWVYSRFTNGRFLVLIFLIFPKKTRASPPPSFFPLARRSFPFAFARLPHTASREPPTIDANRDRDRSRKNSIDANPRSARLERGRASTQRTRETTHTRAEKREREEIPDVPTTDDAPGLRDAMTTNGTVTPFKEGTIKHACFVALERAGAEGLTVRARDGRRATGDSRRGGCPMGVSHTTLSCFTTRALLVRTCGGFARVSRTRRARALTAD